MTHRLVKAARERLFGQRQVGLSARQVRTNVRLGAQRDEVWPGNVTGSNPVAKRLRGASEEAE